ncbi:MAG TPA: hypothetical protein VGF75_01905 [Candidatus Saccharimonadales bacterium]
MAVTISEPIAGGVFYPTLSGKPGVATYQNPPFHPNILNIGGKNEAVRPPTSDKIYAPNGSLQRGRIVGGLGAYNGGAPNTTFIVNFLYNPSTISESRGIDLNNGVLPSTSRNIGDPGQYATGLSTAVSFSLLFDRTFELWDSSYINTQAGTYGCRVDVEALYNLVGINQLVANVPTVVIPKPGQTGKQNIVTQGPMLMAPCNVYFGPNGNGALSYYGYISEMDITWSHFAQTMVPARVEVDLTLTVLPNTTSNYTIGS